MHTRIPLKRYITAPIPPIPLKILVISSSDFEFLDAWICQEKAGKNSPNTSNFVRI